MLPFLDKFKKTLSAMDNVSTEFRPPAYFFSTGNYAVNRISSGDYFRGIPQGRVSIIAGPSDAGKSFLTCNVMMAAQREGAFILAIDSENALDPEYLARVGVDTDPKKFMAVSVVTIADVITVVSDFIKSYQKEYGKYNPDAPKVLMVVDSLDMLITETENSHFESGSQAGDQGQRAKQLKAFLRTTVSRIKALNISFVGTHQVYPADPLKGEGVWAINNAIRYSASQIILVTRLKLKEGDEIVGIRMRVETFKSRFAKPGSKVEVQVPYDRGMHPYSGMLDLLEKDGVVTCVNGWYTLQLPDEQVRFQQGKLLNMEKNPEESERLIAKIFSHPALQQQAKEFDKINATEEPEEIDKETGEIK